MPDDDSLEIVSEGGDAACWLPQVCTECGALQEAELPTLCWRCGAEVVAI